MSERPSLDLASIARALIDSAEDAIISKDLDGVIQTWNPAAERMFGYSAAEAVGQCVLMLIPPELRDEEDRILARLRAGERIEHYETTRITRHGRRFPVALTISPIRDAGGNIIGASKIARDISERRQAEAFRRAKTAELRAVLEAMPAAVLIAEDGECRSVRANRAGYELLVALGGANGAAAGSRDRQASASLDATMPLARDIAPLRRAAAGQAVHDWQERVQLRDGALHHFHGIAVPLADEDGRPRGAVAALIDITSRVQAEQALRESDRRKDEFLAMLAHELRNPLAPIRNGLEIVQRKFDEPDRREWALQVIDRQLTQLTRIIDDLLELAHIVSGKITLARERTTLRAVVGRALETTRHQIQARRHALRVDLPLTEVALHVDPARLAEALANLLANAARFTEPGGTITIAAETADDLVTIRVRDNGRGIEAELLPRVFDIFVQAPQGLARYEGGLGVGLAVVRRIIEMHGGRVDVHSAGRGQGSEFVVTLPLAEAAALERSRREAQPPAGRPRRVLIVDDNRDAADMLAEGLRLEGTRSRAITRGPGCCPKCASSSPTW